jgi:hypothetical protein
MFLDLHGFSPHEYEKVGFGILSVPVYVYAVITPELLDGLSVYSDFKCLTVVDRCPVSVKIPAAKLMALQMSSETQNGDFLGNVPNDFG